MLVKCFVHSAHVGQCAVHETLHATLISKSAMISMDVCVRQLAGVHARYSDLRELVAATLMRWLDAGGTIEDASIKPLLPLSSALEAAFASDVASVLAPQAKVCVAFILAAMLTSPPHPFACRHVVCKREPSKLERVIVSSCHSSDVCQELQMAVVQKQTATSDVV